MIGFILVLILTGLIVGALARLAIPGPNPMSIGMTIGVGVVGSIIAGLIGRALFGEGGGGIILAVIVTAAIVYFLQRNRTRTA